MTLSIRRPIRLKRSVYFRVPNDIVHLINLDETSQVTLSLEQQSDRHLLVYFVLKNMPDPRRPPSSGLHNHPRAAQQRNQMWAQNNDAARGKRFQNFSSWPTAHAQGSYEYYCRFNPIT